jgi:hypothetical protein
MGPSCVIQDLKGYFFGFGRKTVHSYDVIGIIICFCCWKEDSVFLSGEAGRSCPKGCIFDCPFRFHLLLDRGKSRPYTHVMGGLRYNF